MTSEAVVRIDHGVVPTNDLGRSLGPTLVQAGDLAGATPSTLAP